MASCTRRRWHCSAEASRQRDSTLPLGRGRLRVCHEQDEDGEEEMDDGIEDETEEEFDGAETEPEY